jgi:hypothetical protein
LTLGVVVTDALARAGINIQQFYGLDISSAALVDSNRNPCVHEMVRGAVIAMANAALCKTRASNVPFVMNSLYVLDDKITDALADGLFRSTRQTRVNARDIVHRGRAVAA